MEDENFQFSQLLVPLKGMCYFLEGKNLLCKTQILDIVRSVMKHQTTNYKPSKSSLICTIFNLQTRVFETYFRLVVGGVSGEPVDYREKIAGHVLEGLASKDQIVTCKG